MNRKLSAILGHGNPVPQDLTITLGAPTNMYR